MPAIIKKAIHDIVTVSSSKNEYAFPLSDDYYASKHMLTMKK